MTSCVPLGAGSYRLTRAEVPKCPRDQTSQEEKLARRREQRDRNPLVPVLELLDPPDLVDIAAPDGAESPRRGFVVRMIRIGCDENGACFA